MENNNTSPINPITLQSQIASLTESINHLNAKITAYERNTLIDPPFSIDEAADYLKIDKERIYELTRRKLITFSKPTKKIYIYRSELDKYLKKHFVEALSELDGISILNMRKKRN